jgi:hypothetical protein
MLAIISLLLVLVPIITWRSMAAGGRRRGFRFGIWGVRNGGGAIFCREVTEWW